MTSHPGYGEHGGVREGQLGREGVGTSPCPGIHECLIAPSYYFGQAPKSPIELNYYPSAVVHIRSPNHAKATFSHGS